MNMDPDPNSGDAAPVDVNRIMAITDGDKDFEQEMISLFLSDFTKRIEAVEQSLSAGDAETLRRDAHTLKGSSANMGANRLADLARDIEYAARDGALGLCPPMLEAVKIEAERVREFFTDRLNGAS